MDAAIEVRNSINIAFYGTKSEGCNTVVWFHNCTHVAVYGHGGMGTPLPMNATLPAGFLRFPPSLFRVTSSTDVEMAQLVDRPVDPDSVPPAWADPTEWIVLLWADASGGGFKQTLPLDRPVLVRLP